MKKRVAVVLALAVTAAIGVSSPAAGAGDPLYVNNLQSALPHVLSPPLCDPHAPGGCSLPFVPNQVSVSSLLGPGLGDALCTPGNEIKLGDEDLGTTEITICKQP